MSQSKKEEDSRASRRLVSLPSSRVKLIMKSSPDVSSINQDALFLTTRATELFVQHLARASFSSSAGDRLTYSDLATAAEETETFNFLADILPKKILARDYLQSLEQMQEEEEEADL